MCKLKYVFYVWQMMKLPAKAIPEEEKERKKNYKWFVGIDVSKNELDFAVLRDSRLLLHLEIPNKKADIRAFCQMLKKEVDGFRIGNTLFCMEQTGYYCNDLTAVLYALKADFAIENALKIKRSLGILRGKDDKEDAIRIAGYASKHHSTIRLWQPRRPIVDELKQLMSLRNRMVVTVTGLKLPIKEQKLFFKTGLQRKLKTFCENSILALDTDIQVVEQAIDQLIANDAKLRRLLEIITSVKSVGKVTAIHIVLATNEFMDISCPKKFACYAGIAPFKIESGKIKKRDRVSRIANHRMKALLHMCAMGAVYRHPELKTYFERKTKVEGKPRMAVVNAVRYKLILRIFACVQQNRLYTAEYARPVKAAGEPAACCNQMS